MAVPLRQERAAAHVGSYRLGEAIGGGAVAKVLEAIDMRSGQLVALKLLCTHSRGASEAATRFEHGVEDDGTAWLAMERMYGSPLSALIQHEARLEAARALRIVIDMAKALAVHARAMVDRDVKPENVFVTFPGSPPERAKLIDFGVAHVTDQELGEYSGRYTRVGSLLGSAVILLTAVALASCLAWLLH